MLSPGNDMLPKPEQMADGARQPLANRETEALEAAHTSPEVTFRIGKIDLSQYGISAPARNSLAYLKPNTSWW